MAVVGAPRSIRPSRVPEREPGRRFYREETRGSANSHVLTDRPPSQKIARLPRISHEPANAAQVAPDAGNAAPAAGPRAGGVPGGPPEAFANPATLAAVSAILALEVAVSAYRRSIAPTDDRAPTRSLDLAF